MSYMQLGQNRLYLSLAILKRACSTPTTHNSFGLLPNTYILLSGDHSFEDSQIPVGYNRFQIGCVTFEYDLFNATTFIKKNLTYVCFGIILTQFYDNFSSQKHKIDVSQVSFKTQDSQVLSYTPFHFSFTVPLKVVQKSELYYCKDTTISSFKLD